MSFLGIYVFVGIDSESTGLVECEYNYYTQMNLADIWATGHYFTEDDLTKINSIDEVNCAERRIQADGKAIVDGGNELSMQLNFLEGDQISKLWLVDGTPYAAGCKGAYLDHVFAEKNNYKIGDTVSFKINNTTFDVKVEGLVFSPEHVYYLEDVAAMMPSYGDYGYCFMDISEYPFEDIRFSQVVIDAKNIDNTGGVSTAEKKEAEYISKLIKTKLDDDNMVLTGKDDQLSYQTFRSEMNQHKAMAWVFPIVFVLISLLGIITTMTRLMAKQRIQIGTMKALGFSTRDIILHYISYGAVLSFAGSVLGAIAGYYTLPDYIISMFVSTYQLPVMYKGFSQMSFLLIVLEVAVATGITFFACKKECSLIPAEALKPASPKIQKPSAIEKSKLWLKLDFSTQWNIRDILRNKVRTMMGMIGVMGCCMLLLCAFGCLDTIDFITNWMYGELNTASYKIVLADDTAYDVASEYAKQYHGQMVQNAAISLQSGNAVKTGTLTILDTGNYLHFQDSVREHFELNAGEVGMSYKMAESLKVKEGDFITWCLLGDDSYHRMRVGTLYRNPSTQGITMHRKTFERLDNKFVPTEILTNVKVSEALSDKDEIVGVQGTAQMMDSLDAMMEMMYAMAAILIAAAAVLGIVVLYNLGVLSMVEKRREMATLKVLGFTSGGVRGILSQQNTIVTILGIFLGFPAGMGMLEMLFNDMPESMDYFVVIYPKSYAITFAGTFLISWIVNKVLSREVNTIDMVEALKGQE